jgi:hypothetical protein
MRSDCDARTSSAVLSTSIGSRRELPGCVDVRVIPQPNVQVIHHWAPAILSTPSHLLAPVDARR